MSMIKFEDLPEQTTEVCAVSELPRRTTSFSCLLFLSDSIRTLTFPPTTIPIQKIPEGNFDSVVIISSGLKFGSQIGREIKGGGKIGR